MHNINKKVEKISETRASKPVKQIVFEIRHL